MENCHPITYAEKLIRLIQIVEQFSQEWEENRKISRRISRLRGCIKAMVDYFCAERDARAQNIIFFLYCIHDIPKDFIEKTLIPRGNKCNKKMVKEFQEIWNVIVSQYQSHSYRQIHTTIKKIIT